MYFMVARCADKGIIAAPGQINGRQLIRVLAENDDIVRVRKLLETYKPNMRSLLCGISAAGGRSTLDLFCMLFSRLEYADVAFIFIFKMLMKPNNLKLFQNGLGAGKFDDSSLRRIGTALFHWCACPSKLFWDALIGYVFEIRKPGLISEAMVRTPTIDYMNQYLLYTRLAIKPGIKIERTPLLMLKTIADCNLTSENILPEIKVS
jgi:hypothetical protein